MTQPENLSMIVCADCGSVRVPVPAITRKLVTLNGPPQVVPCPVCTLRRQIEMAIEESATDGGSA